VAGGGELISDEITHNCSFTIESKKFTAEFRILNLSGSDIILRANWFTLHNPVTFDFLGRTLTIEVDGEVVTFSDHLVPSNNFLISS
jgi:hypothetical protein